MAVKRRRSLETDNLTSLGVSADGEILDDWDKIVKICNAGRAQDFYESGNWKSDVSTPGEHRYILIGFNKEIDADNFQVVNTTWMGTKGQKVKYFLDDLGNSDSLQHLALDNSNDLSSYPEVLQHNIKSIIKSTPCLYNNYSNKGYDFTAGIIEEKCKLWLLSNDEVREGTIRSYYDCFCNNAFFKSVTPFLYTYIDRIYFPIVLRIYNFAEHYMAGCRGVFRIFKGVNSSSSNPILQLVPDDSTFDDDVYARPCFCI